jgi:hypothetical protein
MQIEVHLTCYIYVPIRSDENMISMFGLANDNGLYIVRLYLNNRPKRGNSSSMEFTQVSSYT